MRNGFWEANLEDVAARRIKSNDGLFTNTIRAACAPVSLGARAGIAAAFAYA